MVSDASAMLVATTHLRLPGGAGSKMRVCRVGILQTRKEYIMQGCVMATTHLCLPGGPGSKNARLHCSELAGCGVKDDQHLASRAAHGAVCAAVR